MIFKLLSVIVLRTLTDLSFKIAVNKLSINRNSLVKSAIQLIKNPFLWGGLLFGALNVGMWCYSLKSSDLSYAYPFLSFSYVTIMIAGKLFFNEHFDKSKLTGMVLILCGVLLLFLG